MLVRFEPGRRKGGALQATGKPVSRVIMRSPPFLLADHEESRTALKVLRARFLAALGMTAWRLFSAACLAPPPERILSAFRLAARTVRRPSDCAGRETAGNCECLDVAGLKPRPSGAGEKSPLAHPARFFSPGCCQQRSTAAQPVRDTWNGELRDLFFRHHCAPGCHPGRKGRLRPAPSSARIRWRCMSQGHPQGDGLCPST
jgi:hypothetical protein